MCEIGVSEAGGTDEKNEDNGGGSMEEDQSRNEEKSRWSTREDVEQESAIAEDMEQ